MGKGDRSHVGWAGAMFATIVHIVSLSEVSDDLSLGLVVPAVVFATLVAGFASLRAMEAGYTPRSALSAVPWRDRGLLLLAMVYPLAYLVPVLREVSEASDIARGAAALLASAVAIYLCVFAAVLLKLPPHLVGTGTHQSAVPDEGVVEVPTVRLATRAVGIYAGFFAVLLVVGPKVMAADVSMEWIMLGMFLWVVGVNLVLLLLLRCPRCRKVSIWAPGGWSTAWVGSTCRWCGQQY